MNRLKAACLGSLLAVALAGSCSAQEPAGPSSPPSITVEGTATTALAPDLAILSFGVVTTRPKASDAVAENSRALAAALATVKAQGIPDDAITTTAIELSPVTDEPKTGAPKVVAYRAGNAVEVRIRATADIGALAATLIDKGVNVVDDIRFASGEEAAARDRLRGDAAKNARHEAEILTTALGVRLGRVLDVAVGTGSSPRPLRMKVAMPVAARPPVPVEPGQLQLTESVTVTFELVQ